MAENPDHLRERLAAMMDKIARTKRELEQQSEEAAALREEIRRQFERERAAGGEPTDKPR